jgi:hypothetical protein
VRGEEQGSGSRYGIELSFYQSYKTPSYSRRDVRTYITDHHSNLNNFLGTFLIVTSALLLVPALTVADRARRTSLPSTDLH